MRLRRVGGHRIAEQVRYGERSAAEQGQWRIKGTTTAGSGNRAGAGTGQSDVPPDVRSSEFHGPATGVR